MGQAGSRGVLQATGVSGVGGVRGQFHSTALEEIVPKASETSRTSPVVVQIGEIVRIDRLADQTVENGAEKADHLRAKLLGSDGVDDDVHRVIEIHQNDAEDFDQNEKGLTIVVAVVFDVGINAQKDHDRRCQTDEDQIDGDQHHRDIPAATRTTDRRRTCPG